MVNQAAIFPLNSPWLDIILMQMMECTSFSKYQHLLSSLKDILVFKYFQLFSYIFNAKMDVIQSNTKRFQRIKKGITFMKNFI